MSQSETDPEPETYQHPDQGIDHAEEDAVAKQGYRPWPQIWNRQIWNFSTDILNLFDWVSEKADRTNDDISPTHVRPQGQPYVDVTHPDFGIEPGEWYSGWDGSTDHTAALQAAIDAARNDNSQVGTFLPGGEYYISSPLELDSSQLISGAGVRSTRILATEPMDSLIKSKDTSSRFDRWRLDMMELECNGNANRAIDLSNIHKWDLEWLYIRGSDGPGIKLHRSWNGRAANVDVGAGSTNAVELGQGSHNVAFNKCYLSYTDGTAVVADSDASSWQVTFNGCQFEGDAGTGAFDLSDKGLTIVVNNGYFEYEDTHPVIDIHGLDQFVLNGGSFSGYQSQIVHVTDTDFRVNDFYSRDFRGDELKFRINSKPNDLSFSFFDGAIRLSQRQIKYLAQPRILDNQINESEGVLDTDSDEDGVADGWSFNGTQAYMANTTAFGPAQRIEINQYDHLRTSFSALEEGDYTIVVVYRIFTSSEGSLEARLEQGSDSTPIRYSSNDNRVEFLSAEDSAWHLANLNITVGADEVTGIRFARPDTSGNTLNAEIAGVQLYRGEYHVGDVTPFDVDM